MSQTVSQDTSHDAPPAARLMQMIFGFVTSQAISVAARLSLADLLKDGAKSADELAQATGTQARPLYRILRALASVDIFAEDDAGRFRLTPLAELLRSDASKQPARFFVQQLRETSPSWLRSKFGVVMERTRNELRGISCLALEEVAAPRKQIISSRSFGQLVHTLPELSESVASYMSSAAEKLRRENSVCEAIQVFVQTNPFREQDPQYSQGITIPLPNASADTRLLVRAALFGLKRIYRPGFAYKKTGVMLIDIGPAARQQLSLLPQHGAGDKSQRLMQVMDKLNGIYGRNTVSVFSAGNRKAWAMRRENMSPCYTTRWRDVPVAHAR